MKKLLLALCLISSPAFAFDYTHFKIVECETLTTGASSVSSTITIDSETLRVMATENAHITYATTPTATTGDLMVSKGVPEYIRVPRGRKVAAIQESAAGKISVCEMSR